MAGRRSTPRKRYAVTVLSMYVKVCNLFAAEMWPMTLSPATAAMAAFKPNTKTTSAVDNQPTTQDSKSAIKAIP